MTITTINPHPRHLGVVPSEQPITSQEWADLADKMLTSGPYNAAEWQTCARGIAAALRHVMKLASMPAPAVKPPLTGWQRKEVESARKQLVDVPDLFNAGRPPAYIAGLLEATVTNLLDIIDATVRP